MFLFYALEDASTLLILYIIYNYIIDNNNTNNNMIININTINEIASHHIEKIKIKYKYS